MTLMSSVVSSSEEVKRNCDSSLEYSHVILHTTSKSLTRDGEVLSESRAFEGSELENIYNSYLTLFYFSPLPLPIPSLAIEPSIDFITLTDIENQRRDVVFDLLDANRFFCESDSQLFKGNYSRKRTYRSEGFGVSVDIFYDEKKQRGARKRILVVLRHPVKRAIDFLSSLFRDHGLDPKLSQIEFSYDFIFHDLRALQQFHAILLRHLFFRYQRSASRYWGTTYYTNNVRKCRREGMRLYPKSWDREPACRQVLRLELLLKREAIRRLGLEWPLEGCKWVDLLRGWDRFFEFRALDHDRLRRYLVRTSKEQIAAVEKRRKGFGGLVVQVIDGWVKGVVGAGGSLMEQVEVLKRKDYGVPNYSRFLQPYSALNDAFRSALVSTSLP
jgi:hypothetical protein